MDVAQILAVGRRWWWLLILGVLFSVASYGVSARVRGDRSQPTFAASTTLFVTVPPLPASALAADASKEPWELDRLMATYAQMAKSRTVAERAVRDGGLATTPDDLVSRINTDTFGYTQLLRISVAAGSPEAADRSVAAVTSAFAEVRGEQSIPGDAAVFETKAAARTDTPTPLAMDIGIVILAGLLASSGIIFAFERLRDEPAPAVVNEQSGARMTPPTAHERAV